MSKNNQEKALEKSFCKTIIAIPTITTTLCVLLTTLDLIFKFIDPSQEMFIQNAYFLKFIFLFICTIPINLILVLIVCFGFIIFGLTKWPFDKDKNQFIY
jgi:hypothetical protein